jgi:hypothetical protein
MGDAAAEVRRDETGAGGQAVSVYKRAMKPPAGGDEKPRGPKQPLGPSARDLRREAIWREAQQRLLVIREQERIRHEWGLPE